MTTALVGCGEGLDATSTDTGDAPEQHDYSLAGTNGLAAINGLALSNGLAGVNGLANINGLALSNGLAGVNGLAATNGLMTTDGGRQTVSYLVRCALNAGDTLVKQDQNGTNYTFAGGLGLCPSWKTSGISNAQTCQNWVSACMLAHVNTAGVHIPIWMVGQASSVGWGQNPNYPNQEGTFFGNIFRANTVGHVDAYYCNGPGFDKDVVPGRIGANQSGAPYRNMFASTFCNINGCVPSDSKTNNVADGYKACSMGDGATNTWNEMLTVWRQNKAYDAGGNVIPGKTADGSTVRYDFESGSLNGWYTTNGQVQLASTGEAGGQTGYQSLKAYYGSGSSTLQVYGPSGLSLGSGTQVSFYLYVASNTALTSINPFIKKAGGGDAKVYVPIGNLLKGSWNMVSITVPSGSTGSQVGVEFQTSGGFTAYVDGVTW